MSTETATKTRKSILDHLLLFSWIAGYAILLRSFRVLQYWTSGRPRPAAQPE